MKFYPPFNYSKIFIDISDRSGFHFNYEDQQYVRGPGFKWGDIFVEQTGVLYNGDEYFRPCGADNFIMLIINGIVFIALAYYFDNVIASNRGISKGKLFFLPNFNHTIKKYLNNKNDDEILESNFI